MKKGFTLLELIIVIVILGILASFAIPQFIRAAEKGRSGEALSLLSVVGQAQIRFGVETGAYTNDYTVLDIGLPVPKFFTIAVLNTGTPGIDDAANEGLATLTRNNTALPAGYGNYSFNICENGETFCTDGTGGECAKLGLTAAVACPALR